MPIESLTQLLSYLTTAFHGPYIPFMDGILVVMLARFRIKAYIYVCCRDAML